MWRGGSMYGEWAPRPLQARQARLGLLGARPRCVAFGGVARDAGAGGQVEHEELLRARCHQREEGGSEAQERCHRAVRCRHAQCASMLLARMGCSAVANSPCLLCDPILFLFCDAPPPLLARSVPS